VNFLITISSDSPSAERLRGLWQWLADRHDPYRIDGVRGTPSTGTLSGALDMLSVALASGGTVSVLVSGIVEWIRNGRGGNRKDVPFAVTIKCADGVELVIDTQIVQAWSPAELTDEVHRLVVLLRDRKPTQETP
jgi:hypothetical protein